MTDDSRCSVIQLALWSAFSAFAAALPAAQADSGDVIRNRSIGYVLTSTRPAIVASSDLKQECPDGLNDGPRERFKAEFPDDGTKRTLAQTQLAHEAAVWFPDIAAAETVPFRDAVGRIAFGLNLDGRISAEDFESPEGEKGIDNQTQRAWGCVADFRSGPTSLGTSQNWYTYNIVVIELTGVDDLVNDPDVTLTTYRGLDKPMTDATGTNYLPRGTVRLDTRWGKVFIQTFKGRIAGGVLTTGGADFLMPVQRLGMANYLYRDAQWRLTLNAQRADGLLGGYLDIDQWNMASNQRDSTHHHAYGQAPAPSVYRAMRRNADAYPDAKTGANTAISTAVKVGFTQVFVTHVPPGTQQMDASAARSGTQ